MAAGRPEIRTARGFRVTSCLRLLPVCVLLPVRAVLFPLSCLVRTVLGTGALPVVLLAIVTRVLLAPTAPEVPGV